MITIQSAVDQIIQKDIDARTAIERGFLNYSQYAKQIVTKVEYVCKKNVKVTSVLVALTRWAKSSHRKESSIIPKEIEIKNVSVKTPIAEIIYEKNISNVKALTKLPMQEQLGTTHFFNISTTDSEVSIICSSGLVETVKAEFKEEPIKLISGLAAMILHIDPERYYHLPGVTFSLSKKIAACGIPLAETITSYSEIIYTFDRKYLAEMVEIFE